MTSSSRNTVLTSTDPAELRQALEEARRATAAHLHRTPLWSSRRLSERVGRPVYLKLENLQRTGSFKARGFMWRLLCHRRSGGGGVLTFSSGNAAQALAYAASQVGCAATVVMVPGADPGKVAATRGYGARVVFADSLDTVAATAAAMAEREGLTLIHPYDDADLLVGHGSLGLEMIEELPADATVVAAVGGGGTVGSLAAVARACGRPTRIVAVYPELARQLPAALNAGHPVAAAATSVAEGLCAPIMGQAGLEMMLRYVPERVAVSDAEIVTAMRALLEDTKQLAEPSGAAALAAVLAGRVDGTGPVAVVVSGGNISVERLKSLL